jgi:hypothetical protein
VLREAMEGEWREPTGAGEAAVHREQHACGQPLLRLVRVLREAMEGEWREPTGAGEAAVHREQHACGQPLLRLVRECIAGRRLALLAADLLVGLLRTGGCAV